MKILLLLSPTQQSKKSVEVALDLAEKEKAELIILFILDKELSEDIVNKIFEESWMTRTASTQLCDAILKEYSFSGKHKVKAVLEAASRRNINCRAISKKGNLLDETMRVIDLEKVDKIVITGKPHRGLSKFFFGTAFTSSVLKGLQKNFCGEIVEVIDST